jgi:hypothetical protein
VVSHGSPLGSTKNGAGIGLSPNSTWRNSATVCGLSAGLGASIQSTICKKPTL